MCSHVTVINLLYDPLGKSPKLDPLKKIDEYFPSKAQNRLQFDNISTSNATIQVILRTHI